MSDELSVLLLDSAILLLVGMSVVFIFLTILIFAIHAIEWISNKLPQPEEAPIAAAPVVVAKTQEQPDAKVVAAITAAVHQYRQKQQ